MTQTAFWKHFPVHDQEAETLVAATLAFDKEYDLDLMKITPAGSWLATCYGTTDLWENDNLGRRTISHRCISRVEDWVNLPDINQQSNLIDTYIKVSEDLKVFNPIKPIFTTVFCPVSQAIQMAGLDLFKAHMESAPDKVRKGLEKITQNTLTVLKRFAATGISGNYFVTQAMQPCMLNPNEYAYWGEPYDQECLNLSAQLFSSTIFHLHGEEVFFSTDKLNPDVVIHFEFHPGYATTYKRIENDLLPGLPASELAHLVHKEEALQAVQRMETAIGRSIPILTAGCVLPLNFPAHQIHFWKELMQARSQV
ncbi:uroporphyrinogen decarboxylase family protein [Mucilaginibacter koreensis]